MEKRNPITEDELIESGFRYSRALDHYYHTTKHSIYVYKAQTVKGGEFEHVFQHSVRQGNLDTKCTDTILTSIKHLNKLVKNI